MSIEKSELTMVLWLGRAIEATLGPDAALACDIILFAHRRDSQSFTLGEFCLQSGHSAEALQRPHRLFQGHEGQAPLFGGHRFESAFDYCLLRMLQSQLVLGGPRCFETVKAIEKITISPEAGEGAQYGVEFSQLLRELLDEPAEVVLSRAD